MTFCTPDKQLAQPYSLFDMSLLSGEALRLRAENFCDTQATLDCDLDFFSLSIRNFANSSAATLMSDEVIAAIRRTTVIARNTTLIVEAKHARRRAFREMRHQVRNHRLICAEFMLRECSRIYNVDRKRFAMQPRRRRRPSAPAKKPKARLGTTTMKRRALNYINKAAVLHKQLHGRVSKEEFRHLRRLWVDEFQGFDEEEQRVQGDHPESDCQEAVGIEALVVSGGSSGSPSSPSPGLGHFEAGDADVPFAGQCVRQELVTASTLTTSRFRALASDVFPDADLELAGSSPHLPGLGGQANPIGGHLSCQQLHFGFCAARHAEQAEATRRVHGHMQVSAKRAKQHLPCDKRRFPLFQIGGGTSDYYLFCDSLRLVATQQQAHLFVRCSLVEPVEPNSVRICTASDDAFDFMTSWMVAVSVVGRARAVQAQQVEYDVVDRLDTMLITRRTGLSEDWATDPIPKFQSVSTDSAPWRALAALRRRGGRSGGRGGRHCGGRASDGGDGGGREPVRRGLLEQVVELPQLPDLEVGPRPADGEDDPGEALSQSDLSEPEFASEPEGEATAGGVTSTAAPAIPTTATATAATPPVAASRPPATAAPDELVPTTAATMPAAGSSLNVSGLVALALPTAPLIPVTPVSEAAGQQSSLTPATSAASSSTASTVGPHSVLHELGPTSTAPYMRIQDRAGNGYVYCPSFSAPVARMTEWPKHQPTNVSIVCYRHAKCRSVWPKRRAPSWDVLREWALRDVGRDEHFKCLPL